MHAKAQAPQFVALVLRFVHSPAQQVGLPLGQTVPQFPQLRAARISCFTAGLHCTIKVARWSSLHVESREQQERALVGVCACDRLAAVCVIQRQAGCVIVVTEAGVVCLAGPLQVAGLCAANAYKGLKANTSCWVLMHTASRYAFLPSVEKSQTWSYRMQPYPYLWLG